MGVAANRTYRICDASDLETTMHGFYIPIWILGAPFILAIFDLLNTRSAIRRGDRVHAY